MVVFVGISVVISMVVFVGISVVISMGVFVGISVVISMGVLLLHYNPSLIGLCDWVRIDMLYVH